MVDATETVTIKDDDGKIRTIPRRDYEYLKSWDNLRFAPQSVINMARGYGINVKYSVVTNTEKLPHPKRPSLFYSGSSPTPEQIERSLMDDASNNRRGTLPEGVKKEAELKGLDTSAGQTRMLPSGEVVYMFNEIPQGFSTAAKDIKNNQLIDVMKPQNTIAAARADALRIAEHDKQISTRRFIQTTKEEAEKGNLAAAVTYHLAPAFTPTNPLGLNTILGFASDIYHGKDLRTGDAEKARTEALTYMWENFGDSNKKPDAQKLGTWLLSSPQGQIGLLSAGSIGVGAAIRSIGIPIGVGATHAASGSKIANAARTFLVTHPKAGAAATAVRVFGDYALKHPKIISAPLFGYAAYKEGIKAVNMYSVGTENRKIVAEVTKDVVLIGSVASGFKAGFESGAPIRFGNVERVTVNKLPVKGKEPITYNSYTSLYRGFYRAYGKAPVKASPIFGKTPEGFKIGAPKFRPETVNKFYGAALRSSKGYSPATPLETRLAVDNILKNTKQKETVTDYLNLRSQTFGVKSKFVERQLPLSETLKLHGLKQKTINNVKTFLEKQKKINVFGSVGQKAQSKGFGFRTPHDVDIMSRDVIGFRDTIKLAKGQKVLTPSEKLASDIIKVIEKTEKKGTVVISKQSASLLESKKGHLFDVHDAYSVNTAGSSWTEGDFVGWGYKTEDLVKIGRLKSTRLSEQATAKMTSSITIRDGKIGPQAHRVKDVWDYLKAEEVLIRSMPAGSQTRAVKSYKSVAQSTANIYGKQPKFQGETSYSFYSSDYFKTYSPMFTAPSPSQKSNTYSKTQTFTILSSSQYKSNPSFGPSLSKPSSFSPSLSKPSSFGPSLSKPSSFSPSLSKPSSFSLSPSRSPSPSPSPSRSPSPSPSPSRSPSPSPSFSKSYYFLRGPSSADLGGGYGGFFKHIKPSKFKREYKPSIYAVVFNVKAKRAPKRLTGVEIRPIVSDRKSKKPLWSRFQ